MQPNAHFCNCSALLLITALCLTFNAHCVARGAEDSSTSAKIPRSPEQTKADEQSDAAAATAVNKAAAALQKEFDAHLEKASTPLRAKSNFFSENRDPAVTPKAIVAALGRGYGSVGASLYVHWQLMSGLSGKVDDSLAPEMVDVYRDAPIAPMRPGMDADQKGQLTEAVSQMTQADVPRINGAFQKQIKEWATNSKLFLDYRDSLIKLTPVTFELVRAEFRDAIQRESIGADGGTTMSAAMSSGRNWAAGDAPEQQLETLSEDVSSLLDEMGGATASSDDANSPDPSAVAQADSRIIWTVAYGKPRSSGKKSSGSRGGSTKAREPAFPPKYFIEVAWDDKDKKLDWKSGAGKFPTKDQLVAFKKSLIQQAEQPDSIKSKTPAAS